MSAERIASLEAQLAEAQATIRDQARALEENARRERERDALRIEQERETERQRILRRERNARHRAARRQGDAGETPVRRSGDVSETSHPSFSSPPLDGPPLSSQTHLSPPLYPLPASSSPLSGLADARPPDAGTKPVTPTSDDLPESAPNDVTEAAGGVESGPIPPLDSPIPSSGSLPGQEAIAPESSPQLAMVAKEGPQEPRQRTKSAGPAPEDLQALWNELGPPKGLQRWEAMSPERRQRARVSLKAVPDLTRWRSWLTAELARPFNLGGGVKGAWKADVDWLLRAKTRDLVADFNPAAAPAPKAEAKPTKWMVL